MGGAPTAAEDEFFFRRTSRTKVLHSFAVYINRQSEYDNDENNGLSLTRADII